MGRRIATFVLTFIVWCLLTTPWATPAGQETGWDLQTTVIGLIAAALVTIVCGDAITLHPGKLLSPVRYYHLVVYTFIFIYYCVVANLQVMYLVLHPDLPIKPGVVKVKTRLKSAAARTALANCITLTPGTLTVDVTDDGYLYVHWLVVESTEMKAATHDIVERFEERLEKILE